MGPAKQSEPGQGPARARARGTGQVTIREVARRAGVSIGTVSRVINGHRAVNPSMRRTVESAIEDLRYQPNASARNLRLGRTGTIGVVISDLANPIFTPTVQAIERVALAHGTSLFLCDAGGVGDTQAQHLVRLFERRVDGVILHPTGPFHEQLTQFHAAGVPVVVIGQRRATQVRPEIVVDERTASRQAFDLLLGLGHRRIGLILQRFGRAPLLETSAQEDRIGAYRAAHAAAGVAVDERLIIIASSSAEARDRARGLLLRSERPTALVSGAHPYTPDLLAAVQETGLLIPDDVSFLSYGDSPWAQVHQPPLTVIRTDYPAYGRRAAELLFALIEGEAAETSLAERAELVLRDSFAAAPASME